MTRALLCACALTLPGVALVAPAQAAPTTIAEYGSGPGRVNVPMAVAVNETGAGVEAGTLYVADRDNRRIDRFGPAGDFQLAWGFGVADGRSLELQACGPQASPPRRRCFRRSRASNEGGNLEAGAGAVEPLGVVVDQAGDVYVLDGKRRVQKFGPDGQFLWALGAGVVSGGAAGTGDTEAGSDVIGSVAVTHKAFLNGEAIAGPGIPPGTVVKRAFDAGGGLTARLVISKPATATATGVAVSVPEGAENTPLNERQTIALGAGVGGGNFKLSFTPPAPEGSSSQTTADIPFNASAVEVQSALEALSNIGAGDIAVSSPNPGGGAGPGGPYTVEFSGARYADTNVQQMSADPSGLTIGLGSKLTCTGGPKEGAGSPTLSYRWLANGTPIGGAISAEYTLQAADLEKAIQCQVTATNTIGSTPGGPTGSTQASNQLFSGTPSGELPGPSGNVPAPAAPVGGFVAGKKLICSTGTWSGSPSFAYQWYRNGIALSGNGAETSEYTLQAADLTSAAAFQCMVTATNANGSLAKVSANRNTASPAPVPNPAAPVATATATLPPLTASASTAVQGASAAELCTIAADCIAGVAGSGPGQLSSNEGEALAFDSSGELWVTDAGRLQRFDSSGAFLSEVTLPAGTQTAALAIDPATDDFYLLGPSGANERQEFESPQSGEYTLSFKGQSTAPIAAGASAEAIQASLEALSTIGAGNVRVVAREGFPADRTMWVSFVRDLGGRDVAQMSATGGSPSVAVHTGREGATGSVRRLDSTGALVETLDADPGAVPRALAVDSAGNLYVGDLNFPYRFLKFDSTGELTSIFAGGQAVGEPAGNALAVDEEGSGRLYVASSVGAEDSSPDSVKAEVAVQAFTLPEAGPLPDNLRAEDVLPTSATLAATLNPEGATTTYRFEYVTQQAYEEDKEGGGDGFEGPATEETPEEPLAGSGYEDEALSAAIEHLIPETAYRFRLVAKNEAGEVASGEETFITRAAVGIEAQWASGVAAREATARAELDPLGALAAWWLEYGASPCSQGGCQESAKAALPAGFGAIALAVCLSGLEPGATYHYRFAAEDERDGLTYTVYGADRAFTTQGGGLGFELPDSRAWELVSPPDKHGARLRSPSEGHVQAAADGDALAYLSRGSIEAHPEGNRSPEDSSALAWREGVGEWASKDLTPPNAAVFEATVGRGLEYKLFNPDLSEALLEPRGSAPLSPWASERTPYLRSNAEPPTYTPLAVGCPPEGVPCPAAVAEHANVPAGTEFGFLIPGSPVGKVGIAGATADLRHVVLSSLVPLAEGVAGGGLYEWEAGELRALSVLPGPEGAVVGAVLGSDAGSVRGAVSEDGSRVFWSTPSQSQSFTDLYLRDTAREESLRLDVVQPGAFGTGAAAPRFLGADPAGTVAFFTDTQNLTEDANEAGADLYRCRVTVEGGELGCELSDLTAQTENPADRFESADVQGFGAGMSEDATRLYFVARGVLDGENAEGASPAPGEPNLYLWQQGEGIRFIATLAEEDRSDWGVPAQRSAAASPSGRYLAFMSQRPLTGYDNRDARSGEADQEVFRYDAEVNGGEGELICASCDPSGARPAGLRGFEAEGLNPAYDPQRLWAAGSGVPARALAAVLPEATKISAVGASLYRPRAVHDDGRLFFNAADSLVPADSNGTWDVYEYEPTAVGSCTAASGDAASARSAGGCVSLISSGTGEGESAFVDASEGGGDVFFWSDARLSVTDVDDVTDIYDARVNGVAATLHPLAECLGEACQPAAFAPEVKTPASAAFHGPGNLGEAASGPRHCPKGERKVRHKGKVRCVERHRRRHRQRGHRHDGRAG